jgi:hypothetical protein
MFILYSSNCSLASLLYYGGDSLLCGWMEAETNNDEASLQYHAKTRKRPRATTATTAAIRKYEKKTIISIALRDKNRY